MKGRIKIVLSLILLVFLTSNGWAEVLFKDTEGKKTYFSSLKGKWVFLNYWASWCTSCIEEIPEFNQFYKKHKKDKVALFAVNYDDLPLAEHHDLIHKFKIKYPNLIKDPAGDLQLGNISVVPVTFIFNPAGELVHTLYGGQTAKSLEGYIHNPRKSS